MHLVARLSTLFFQAHLASETTASLPWRGDEQRLRDARGSGISQSVATAAPTPCAAVRRRRPSGAQVVGAFAASARWQEKRDAVLAAPRYSLAHAEVRPSGGYALTAGGRARVFDDMQFYAGDPFAAALAGAPDVHSLIDAHVQLVHSA
jgi:hypothetical protein